MIQAHGAYHLKKIWSKYTQSVLQDRPFYTTEKNILNGGTV
jgi:hypothetical protein